MTSSRAPSNARLVDVTLDSSTILRADADTEHERAVAIFDLLERNFFWPVGHVSEGSVSDYKLTLGIIDERLVFSVYVSGGDSDGSDDSPDSPDVSDDSSDSSDSPDGSDDISDSSALLSTHILSLTPFRKVIKDYFHICDSYYEAIRSAAPSRIESIDMARRGLHNDGSEILRDRLSGKIELDLETARRLFTLICALHRR